MLDMLHNTSKYVCSCCKLTPIHNTTAKECCAAKPQSTGTACFHTATFKPAFNSNLQYSNAQTPALNRAEPYSNEDLAIVSSNMSKMSRCQAGINTLQACEQLVRVTDINTHCNRVTLKRPS